jgi:hypothetical protein
VRFRGLLGVIFVACACACAAAPVAPKPVAQQQTSVDEEASVDASAGDVIDASATTLSCDPPRVRDSVTLACTDHAPCPAGRDLASGACVESCPPGFPTRRDDGGCTCPLGLTLVQGAELGGCIKPGDLDFSKMCKEPHQHFDGSIVPMCKCDAGYVESFAGGAGLTIACVRPCKAPLAYDVETDRCRTCPADQPAKRGVCSAKCPPSSRRDASGECVCPDNMMILDGKCAHCTAGRVYDPKTFACNCPTGTEDWGYTEGCLAACPTGQHRLHAQCIPDCAPPQSNDAKTGACGACDASQNAFVFQEHGRPTCIRCSFDEVLAKTGECECRPGFRRANNHCVSP